MPTRYRTMNSLLVIILWPGPLSIDDRPLSILAMETRPRFLDYLLMVAGSALSILLADLSGLHARPPEATSSAVVSAIARTFPSLLFLGVGVVLLWPVFYMNQRILGRKEDLTWGEWLWGLAWLGYLALTGWIAWKSTGAA